MASTSTVVAWGIGGLGVLGLFGPAVVDTGLTGQQDFWIAAVGGLLASAAVLLLAVSDDDGTGSIGGSPARIIVAAAATLLFFVYVARELYAAPF